MYIYARIGPTTPTHMRRRGCRVKKKERKKKNVPWNVSPVDYLKMLRKIKEDIKIDVELSDKSLSRSFIRANVKLISTSSVNLLIRNV